MIAFLIRLAITAMSLWVAAGIVPGIEIEGTGNIFLAALLLGIVNAFVRPIAVILTLPISALTLGLFLLVINAAMLGLVAYLMDDFVIHGFFSALLGSLIVSIVSTWALWTIGPRDDLELIIMKNKKFDR